MGADLVAEKVEIDPSLGTASLAASEDSAIEVPCTIEIRNREGEVERNHHCSEMAVKKARVMLYTGGVSSHEFMSVDNWAPSAKGRSEM